MDLELKGKRALITGGSSGIGLAIARELAREGVRVAIAARGADKLEAAARQVSAETGAEVITATVDTGSDASVRDMVQSVAERLGGIDILVNSAAIPFGTNPSPALADITDEAFYAEINTKVMGYVRCAREAAPYMIKSGWGRIINISGLAARQAVGVIGSIRNVSVAAMTKNLADQLGKHGINVTVIHPGVTRTERTAGMMEKRAAAAGITPAEAEAEMGAELSIGRIVDSAEIAYVAAFLASPKSVSITGDAIPVAGGVKGPIYY